MINEEGDDISVLLNDGAGRFEPELRIPSDDLPNQVAIADFDDDGVDEIVITNQLSRSAELYRWTKEGGFDVATAVESTLGSAASVHTGDFNSDGNLDLALAIYGTNGSLRIYPGDGDGGFIDGQFISMPTAPYRMQVADVTGDGSKDLLAITQNVGTVRAYRGLGDGTFEYVGNTTLPTRGLEFHAADFSGDGVADIAFVNPSVPIVYVVTGPYPAHRQLRRGQHAERGFVGRL